ncbi:MAG: hypothetical protein JJU45_01785 [Acidimicrobiia bacterium]|nr:hypothetical protein [Acidimicrobiia bacterium]
MTRHVDRPNRLFLVALAVCCAGPMLLIVVLTSVVGIAVGPAAAATIGAVAAGLCVAVMVVRHRRAPGGHDDHSIE